MAKHSKAHPGFTAAAASIERKEGVSKATADKELGYAKAHASAKAKRANPHLLNEAHGHDHPATHAAMARAKSEGCAGY